MPYLTSCNLTFAIGVTANYLVIYSHPIATPTKVAILHRVGCLGSSKFPRKDVKNSSSGYMVSLKKNN
ncbi:hypothetical protein J6Y73_05490 [bacterium]|nr:hypothetical protein [bacterium]